MSCLFCGGETFKQIRTCSNHPSTLEYDICLSCELATRPHDQRYDTFTRDTLFKTGHMDIDNIAKSYSHVANRVQQLKPSGKLLDYGCATGGVLKLMQEMGYEVLGFDISPIEIEVCKEFGFPGTTSLEEVSGNKYDVIWCSETIEHIEDPREFARFARDHINPGGILYIQTQEPDLSLETKIDNGYAYQPAHSNLMSPRCVSKLIEGYGFVLLEQGRNKLGCHWGYYEFT